MNLATNRIGDDTVISALRESPEVTSFMAKQAEKIAGERRELAKRRDELSGPAAAKQWGALSADIEHRLAARDAAVTAMREAQRKLDLAVLARSAFSNAQSREVDKVEARLIETADTAIDAFIADMNDAREATFKMAPVVDVVMDRNPNTGVVKEQRTARGATPSQRLEAIRVAIEKARNLKFEADQRTVAAQLAQLRNSIPVVGQNAQVA